MSNAEIEVAGSKSAVDRLVDLGNHNRLAAMATLLTIITGVAFVVDALFMEKKGVDVAELAAALAAAQMQASELAEKQSDAVDGDGDKMAAIEAILAEQQAALAKLAEEAQRRDSSRAEQDRIVAALLAFAGGEPEQSLRSLEQIANVQEARGEKEKAAETWTSRSALQRFTDPMGHVRDLQRALALLPDNASWQIKLGMAAERVSEYRIAAEAYRHAARLANEERDGNGESIALMGYRNNLLAQLGDHGEDVDVAEQLGEAEARLRELGAEEGGQEVELEKRATKFALVFYSTYVQTHGSDEDEANDMLARLDRFRIELRESINFAKPDLDDLFALCFLNTARIEAMIQLGDLDEVLSTKDEVHKLELLLNTLDGNPLETPVSSMARLTGLGNFLAENGHAEDAIGILESAVKVTEPLVEQRQFLPYLLWPLDISANVNNQLGRTDEANACFDRMLEIYQLFHPNEAMAPQLWRNIFNTHMAVAKRVMVTEAPRATRLIAEARSIQDTHLKGTEFDADEAVSALEAQLPQ